MDVHVYSNEFDNTNQNVESVGQTGAEGEPVTVEKQNMPDVKNTDGQIDNVALDVKVRENIFVPNKAKSSPDTDISKLEDVDKRTNKENCKNNRLKTYRGTKENTSEQSNTNSSSDTVTSKLENVDEIKKKINNKEQVKNINETGEKELTETEIKLWKESFEMFKTYVKFINNVSIREKLEDTELKNAIEGIHRCSFALKNAPHIVCKRYQTEYFKELASSGAVPILCEIILYILTTGYKFETGKVINSKFDLLRFATSTLINFSDGDPEDAYLIADYPQFLVGLGQKLTEFHEKGLSANYTGKESDATILKRLLSIIHNLGMADGNEQKLRSHNFVQILEPYLECSVIMFRLSSLAILANIVNEEESKILQTNPENLKFLMYTLKIGTENETRRTFGWSVKELCRAIRGIARNDSNKKALVDRKSIELLVAVAAGNDVEEQREAVGILRSLSFDGSIQQFFISNTDLGVIETFIKLQSSPDKEIRKDCVGALWTMREILSKNERYKDSVKHIVSNIQTGNENQGHVMISYQWRNQETLVRIKDMMRSRGFKVWMDVDDMTGSITAAMAQAVQNASIVLVCYSQKYKDSNNCHAEADYAYHLNKKIIPLRMESKYKPDGWLGLILGTKKYFDFAGKHKFDEIIEKLFIEIHSQLQGKVQEVAATVDHEQPLIVSRKQTTESMAPLPSEIEVVKNWSDTDVKHWLDQHSLDRRQFNTLRGKDIAFLQIVRQESPDFFYRSLTDMLKINDLFTMSDFVFALEDIKKIQDSQ